jgi:hypothetical protein
VDELVVAPARRFAFLIPRAFASAVEHGCRFETYDELEAALREHGHDGPPLYVIRRWDADDHPVSDSPEVAITRYQFDGIDPDTGGPVRAEMRDVLRLWAELVRRGTYTVEGNRILIREADVRALMAARGAGAERTSTGGDIPATGRSR